MVTCVTYALVTCVPTNERTIPAHKYVLAVSSPVFFAMFYGDLAERSDTIDITDCDPDIFLHLLRFMYCDETNFPDVDVAVKILYLADKYDIPSLANECVAFLDVKMAPVNAFDIVPHARRLNNKNLESICWELIDYNAEVIVADDSFMDIKQDLLLEFLERSSLCIDETSLFEAVNGWAARRCEEAGTNVNGENKRAVLGEDLLKHFRFSLMSPGEFSNTVLPTEILLTSEVIDVFKQFTSVNIPGGYKFSKSPRKASDQHLPREYVTTGDVYGIGLTYSYHRGCPTLCCKSGLLRLAVNRDVMLCGVHIFIAPSAKVQRKSVSITLSITQQSQKIREIKDQEFALTVDGPAYKSVCVIFNRPVPLLSNYCYTIETKTDFTYDRSSYVWSESLTQQSTSSTPRSSPDKEDIVSKCTFGNAGICPKGQCVGEIMQLTFIDRKPH